MKRLKILKSRRGSGLLTAVAVSVFILLLASCFLEYSHLQSTTRDIRDAVQAAVTETCEEQCCDLYNGVREGYSGGYQLSGSQWREDLSPSDIYTRLDTSLGTREDGGSHVKYAGNDVNYRLSGLSAQITNAPFAPDGHNTGQLTCTAEIDIEIPFSFIGRNLPPMKAHLSVKSGYTPKF